MTVMASGSAAAMAKAQPVLDAVAKKVWNLGEAPGLGSTMKVVHQLLAGVHIAVAAETRRYATETRRNADDFATETRRRRRVNHVRVIRVSADTPPNVPMFSVAPRLISVTPWRSFSVA